MVKNYLLCVSAELKNLTEFQPYDANFVYHLKLKCENVACRAVTEREAHVSMNIQVRSPTRGGGTNLVIQCRNCSRTGTVKLLPGTGFPLTLSLSKAKKFTPIMEFQCRSFVPVDFSFRGLWKARAISLDAKLRETGAGDNWVDVDLWKTDSFSEFCEPINADISISALEHQFRVVGSDPTSSFSPAGVIVSNLDPNIAEVKLTDTFSVYGGLSSIKVNRSDQEAVAFINFYEKHDAETSVLALNGKNRWNVELSNSSKKKEMASPSKKKGRRTGNDFNDATFSILDFEPADDYVSEYWTMKERHDCVRGLIDEQKSIFEELDTISVKPKKVKKSGLEKLLKDKESVLKRAVSCASELECALARSKEFIQEMTTVAKKEAERVQSSLTKEVKKLKCKLDNYKKI